MALLKKYSISIDVDNVAQGDASGLKFAAIISTNGLKVDEEVSPRQ